MPSTVQHVGGDVWRAELDQDAMETIVHVLRNRRGYRSREDNALTDAFIDALVSAFPDGTQDPTP